MLEAKTLFEIDDDRNFLPLPTTRQPPPRISINKNPASLVQVFLNDWNELSPGHPPPVPIVFHSPAPIAFQYVTAIV